MAARDDYPWIAHLERTAETNTRNQAAHILAEVDRLRALVDWLGAVHGGTRSMVPPTDGL